MDIQPTDKNSSHKLTFNNYNNKCITLEDKIYTLPHGHNMCVLNNYFVYKLLIFINVFREEEIMDVEEDF